MTARLSALAPWLAFAAILAAAPRVFPSATALTMMSVMGVMIIFALSYNMLLGQTGLLSFGHAVYYGLGGFVAIHAMNAVIHEKLGVSIPVIPLVGGLAGLAFGVVFGLVSTRRAGIVFSMISLGIGELVSSSSFILRTFFGGEEGITTNRSKLAPFFGHKFGPQLEVYYLIAVWCFFCVLAMYALTQTPFGRMCNAVRENPERVEFVGYSPRMVRLIAFCFAAFFAGIAGGLAAISFEIVNAQQLGAQQSSLVLLMAYIGGVGSFAGPIVGAVIIAFLQIMLSDVTSAWQLYFGLMFIAVVMFAPEGVVGWTMLHLRALRGGAAWRLAPAYAAVGPALAASGAGAIMIIELTNRQLAEARSEGSAMRLFGFDLDASTLPPWIVAIALFALGTGLVLRLWPRVGDAWAPSTRVCISGARDERGALARRSSQEFRPRADHSRRLARYRRGRATRDHRAEWRRQVDAVQPCQRPHPAKLRRGASARSADHRALPVRDQSSGLVTQLSDHQHLSEDVGRGEFALRGVVVARPQIRVLDFD